MPVIHRAVTAAAVTAAAAGVVAAAVLMSPSGSQNYRDSGAVSTSARLARPGAARGAFLAPLRRVQTVASTVPQNGDVNPYGVAVIWHSAGRLHAGDVLVSNYNDKANLQGTGSTIVEIGPGGQRRVFAHITRAMLPARGCPGGVGLSTALTVLPFGWVAVGSAPSANGQVSTAKAGCVIILDSLGRVAEILTGSGIDGPWDATAVSHGSFADLFVTNVFNGTAAGHGRIVNRGTVVRISLRLFARQVPRVLSSRVIASGLSEKADPAAFVLGPTGVGLRFNGTLYIADTASNTITAIPNALTRARSAGSGRVVAAGGALAQPLGMAIAPNGDILTVNGGNGKIVETTPAGAQIATRLLDTSGRPAGAGALFGLAVAPREGVIYYVDDIANTLRLLR